MFEKKKEKHEGKDLKEECKPEMEKVASAI